MKAMPRLLGLSSRHTERSLGLRDSALDRRADVPAVLVGLCASGRPLGAFWRTDAKVGPGKESPARWGRAGLSGTLGAYYDAPAIRLDHHNVTQKGRPEERSAWWVMVGDLCGDHAGDRRRLARAEHDRGQPACPPNRQRKGNGKSDRDEDDGPPPPHCAAIGD